MALAKKKSAPKRERKPKLSLVGKETVEEVAASVLEDVDAAAEEAAAESEPDELPASNEPEEPGDAELEETLDDFYGPTDPEDEQEESRIEVVSNPIVGLETEIIPPRIHAPHGKLIAGRDTQLVTRAELSSIVLPEATATFKPIAHSFLIDQLEEALSFRRIVITDGQFAVTPDGMRMFALLEVDAEYDGVRFAIALRNANDRSMRVGMVAGYRVFVCSNMSMSGDFKPLLAKHTKHFDLVDAMALGVDRIQRSWGPLRQAIDTKRNAYLTEEQGRSIIYRAFMNERFPIRIMKAVHQHFFVSPEHEEFKAPTMWSLENAFTTAFKELLPVRQFEMTARLGKYLTQFST